MELRTNLLRVGVFAAVVLFAARGFSDTHADIVNNEIQAIMSSQQKIETLGFEKALAASAWPDLPAVTPQDSQSLNSMSILTGDTDLPWDECNFNPLAPGCSEFPSINPISMAGSQIKDDAVQILTTEVLYQTLDFFKVKHVFGKLKGKVNTWGFKVIEPKDSAPYQDLESETVLYAVKQFRKYIIGLLCNQPNPSRILAMMNRYNVGTRFRWDMAWVLLGNDLPEGPNKYMRFGVKWRKFSASLDGIENGSLMRLRNGNTGAWGDLNPGGLTPPVGTGTTPVAKMGFIAKEVVGIMRLAGDIVAAILDLFCVSDLSVDPKKELEKQTVVYKLLEVKKRAYDRYGPLRPILEEIGKKATEGSGKPVTVFP